MPILNSGNGLVGICIEKIVKSTVDVIKMIEELSVIVPFLTSGNSMIGFMVKEVVKFSVDAVFLSVELTVTDPRLKRGTVDAMISVNICEMYGSEGTIGIKFGINGGHILGCRMIENVDG